MQQAMTSEAGVVVGFQKARVEFSSISSITTVSAEMVELKDRICLNA